jgi:hypothetical protein
VSEVGDEADEGNWVHRGGSVAFDGEQKIFNKKGGDGFLVVACLEVPGDFVDLLEFKCLDVGMKVRCNLFNYFVELSR